MKKTLTVLTLSLIIVSCATEKQMEQGIRVGAILPLTGGASFFGEEMEKGMQIALEEYESVELFVEDSETNPTEGVSAFRILTEQKNVDVSVVFLSAVAGAVMPLSKQQQAPVLLSGVSSSKVAASSPYAFRYYPPAEQDAGVMIEYSVHELGVRTAATLTLQDEYGLAFKESFHSLLEENGGSIVAEEIFNRSDTDFRTQLTKIKAKNPDALYIIGFDPHLVTILQQVRELQIESTVLTNVILSTPAVIQAAGETAEGVYMTTPTYYLPGQRSDVGQIFFENFQKKYDKEPSSFAAIGYDIIAMLSRTSKSSDPNWLLDGLQAQENFAAAMGELITDEDGEISFPLYPAVIENGMPKLVE